MKIKGQWWVLFVEGILLLLLGIICLLNPFAVTLAFPTFLAILLCLGGFVQLLRSFLLRHDIRAFALSFFSSLFSILVGLLMYQFQEQSILLLSCLMIAYLCFDGISKMFFSSLFHYTKSWTIVMVSGFLSLSLGLLLMMSLPVSSIYSIGLLLGVSMLFFGFSLLVMSIEIKQMKPVEIY